MTSFPHTSPLHLPIHSWNQQDLFFGKAFGILRSAISERAFPGCSLAITYGGKLVASKALGQFTYEAGSPAVLPETIFDIASLSKVVATSAMAMLLYERGQLDLDCNVESIVPEFANNDDPRRPRVTVHMLLSHSSGLPGYEKLFKKFNTREALVRAAFATPLKYDPATHVEYSDIGFIILGELLARIADEPLDRFCKREIFGRLGMVNTCFRPPSELKATIPPTVDDHDFRHRIVQGEVNDENAGVMGGVAGHAGVFAPANEIAIFAHTMLGGGAPILRRETVELFTRRETQPPGTSRALGWDTPSGNPSQSGTHFSPASFGHLGYTGTSLWIDPERQLSVTLLTNRTWPDCRNEKIKQVRPQFHNALIEALNQ